MKHRLILLSALTLSFASNAALATDVSREQVRAELAAWQNNPVSADGYRFVGGELGHVYEAPRTAIGSGTGATPLTRGQVRRDYEQFRNDPITTDGYRFVGGEVGYVFEGPGAAHASVMGSGTGAAPLTREQVRRDYQQFLENPVTADGYRFMGGDLGYEYEGTAR